MRTKSNNVKAEAFSLVELLTAVSLLGILAMMGYSNVAGIAQSARHQKLQSEVATLNSAVSAYLGFGGDLDTLDTSDEVIKRLRSVSSSEMASRIPGFSSSMIDDRIGLRYQTKKEAATDQTRAFWNGVKKRFELSTKGDGGIAAFYLKDPADVEAIGEDDRRFAFVYSEEDSWVWDYNDNSAKVTSGPSAVETADSSTIPISFPPSAAVIAGPQGEGAGSEVSGGSKPSLPGGGGASEVAENEVAEEKAEEEEEAIMLSQPLFSIPGGGYPSNEYDLQLVLSNPNPTGSSSVFYRVDFGTWRSYASGTVIEVAADQYIDAQAVTRNEKYSDSSPSSQLYTATAFQLEPPVINLSDSSFGVFDRRLIAVVLQDRNSEEIPSTLEFKLNESEWMPYSDDDYLLLDRTDFEQGAVIYARAISKDSNYMTSRMAISTVTVDPIEMMGTKVSEFYNPSSENFLNMGMVTNLGYASSTNEYFEWGRISDFKGTAYEDFSKSWMEFEAVGAANVSQGSQFQIGELEFYNGNFVAGTGADSIDFDIGMSLNLDGISHDVSFSYEFDLVNTENDDSNMYGWESADYVKIDQPNSSTTFEIDGVTFELVLEFGDASSNGMADFDEFHVREEFSAGTNVYATLFDRTESQGTVDGSGKAIEVASISKTVDEESVPGSSKKGADFWVGLKSFLNQFLKVGQG